MGYMNNEECKNRVRPVSKKLSSHDMSTLKWIFVSNKLPSPAASLWMKFQEILKVIHRPTFHLLRLGLQYLQTQFLTLCKHNDSHSVHGDTQFSVNYYYMCSCIPIRNKLITACTP